MDQLLEGGKGALGTRWILIHSRSFVGLCTCCFVVFFTASPPPKKKTAEILTKINKKHFLSINSNLNNSNHWETTPPTNWGFPGIIEGPWQNNILNDKMTTQQPERHDGTTAPWTMLVVVLKILQSIIQVDTLQRLHLGWWRNISTWQPGQKQLCGHYNTLGSQPKMGELPTKITQFTRTLDHMTYGWICNTHDWLHLKMIVQAALSRRRLTSLTPNPKHRTSSKLTTSLNFTFSFITCTEIQRAKALQLVKFIYAPRSIQLKKTPSKHSMPTIKSTKNIAQMFAGIQQLS